MSDTNTETERLRGRRAEVVARMRAIIRTEDECAAAGEPLPDELAREFDGLKVELLDIAVRIEAAKAAAVSLD